MTTDPEKIVESTHDIPTAIPTVDAHLRGPDGSLDHLKVQARLVELQKIPGDTITTEEIKECIGLIRLLRRTNTGPAAGKKPAGKKSKLIDVPLEDL